MSDLLSKCVFAKNWTKFYVKIYLKVRFSKVYVNWKSFQKIEYPFEKSQIEQQQWVHIAARWWDHTKFTAGLSEPGVPGCHRSVNPISTRGEHIMLITLIMVPPNFHIFLRPWIHRGIFLNEEILFHIRKPSICRFGLDLAPLWIWLWGPKSNLPILQVCGIDFRPSWAKN